MKITDVKLTVVHRASDARPDEYAIKNKGDTLIDLFNKFTVLQIVTDEGVTGESFSLGGDRGFAHYIADNIAPSSSEEIRCIARRSGRACGTTTVSGSRRCSRLAWSMSRSGISTAS